MKYQRPRLTLYFAVTSIICLTMVFAFLDFKFTLIPRMAYHLGHVEEDDYVHKFEDIFNDTTRKTKKILVWTPFFRTVKKWAEGINNQLKNCSYVCTATHNRVNLPLSDAIIFHDADIDINDMPGLRIRRQPWILFTLEPTALIKKNYNWMNGMFNWTISYRNYSTILAAYGGYVPKRMNTPTPPLVSLKNKNKTMYASISNCHDAGRRFKLIKEIMRYIDVELFGRCGDRKCTNFGGPCHSKEILNLYKFRLAFENSHCRHYVTEKYWSTLAESDTIPIVNWIKGQINPTVIPNSYINFFDFENISDFVNYIEKVGANETLFQQYFEWKKTYELGKSDSDYCKLCEKLHKPYQSQVYTDLGGWFKEDTCTKYSLIGMAGRWVDRRIFNIFNK
ncbi:alpha-(1,3)-fucosyltransferase fut-5-like [Mytilus trossulus]|uniref:alpha-(1,3)-fucosyltransferase fut-5-like n=1 Tax=Mytilus trossulus TaxID=6551 RepID=UPI003007D1F4